MARFSGPIGFGFTEEDPPESGNWKTSITSRDYRGDVNRDLTRVEPGEKVNSDIVIDNSISVIADGYAIEHFMYIKYVGWAGQLWTVTNVLFQRPRLILTLGSVYNGPTP